MFGIKQFAVAFRILPLFVTGNEGRQRFIEDVDHLEDIILLQEDKGRGVLLVQNKDEQRNKLKYIRVWPYEIFHVF